MRVTLVTNIPTPYRAPLYSELSARLNQCGGDLTVVYGARAAKDRQWVDSAPPVGTARSVFVPNGFVRLRAKQTYVNPLVVGSIRRSKPDVVVLSGFAPWNFPAALWCSARGIPYLIWSGETLWSIEFALRVTLRRLPLIRRASGFLAYGPDAATYLVSIGAPRDRITVVGNGIDVEAFASAVELVRPQRATIRSDFGLRRPTILSVGGKGLGLVDAAMNRMSSRPQLLLVGSRATELEIPDLVNVGRVAAAQMASVYVAADCLVHPAGIDRWPHGINEALAAGIPVIASASSGIPAELLSGPGCAIVPLEPEPLGAAIEAALSESAASNADIRDAIRQRVAAWSVPRMASRWLTALKAALGERNESASG